MSATKTGSDNFRSPGSGSPRVMPGGGQPIAGVAAHAAHDGCALPNESRHLPTRRLHEPLDRDAESLLGERVDLSDLLTGESWKGAGRQMSSRDRAGGWNPIAKRPHP